jgi:sugar phosphate isomerase/epimerase
MQTGGNVMHNEITMFDYNADWAMIKYNLEARDFPGYMTREDVIRFYGTLGVDGVDIRHCYWGDCSVQEIKKLASGANLPIVSYENDVDMAWPSAIDRKKAIDRVRPILDRTAELGAPLLMLFPGSSKDGVSADELRKYMIEALAECADYAKSVGVVIGFENIDYEPWRPIHGKAAQCRQICDAINSPALRFILDACAALFVDEDPVDMLRTMAPYIVHVHLKNSRPVMKGEYAVRTRDTDSGRRLTGTVLDGGLVQIPAVLDELTRINYQGRLMIEFQGENDPRPALKYNVEYLRRQMSHR